MQASSHVVACDLGPATVLVNYRTGTVNVLTGASARWWRQLADTGTPTALDLHRAGALLGQLLTAGLLAPVDHPRPWPEPVPGPPPRPSWGTDEVEVGRRPNPPSTWRAVAVAGCALALVLTVRHAGAAGTSMARLTRLLTSATQLPGRPATKEQAETVAHAVRRAAHGLPGRIACLEESVAVVLILAASGRRVTWCHGAAADPIRLHAWVEIDARPVAEPPSTLRYARLRTIPRGRGDHHQRRRQR